MAGPGEEIAAAGRGRLRASHADREQVIGTLKAAFVQGMLARDEFGQRVSQAFTSRTHADLAAVTAGLADGRAGTARCPCGSPEADEQGGQGWARICAAIPIAVPVALRSPTGAIPVFSCLPALLPHGLDYRGRRGSVCGQLAGGQRLARAVRHPGACHRQARIGSFLRGITVTGTSPKQPEAVVWSGVRRGGAQSVLP